MTEINSKKTVLVTGASRGIGLAVADTFAKAGFNVAGTATIYKSAQLIEKRLQAINPNCMGLSLDITKNESINECLANIRKTLTDPLIIINNAGITNDSLLMRMKDEEWESVLDTNLNSNFKITKACIKPMIKTRYGRIINISSVVGLTGNAGQTNYTASKAGVIGFTKSIARELGARNITANCIAPGFIQTDMTDKLPEEQKENLTKQIPLNRLGQPQDIADCALYLVQKGDYITGQTLHINGGMYLC